MKTRLFISVTALIATTLSAVAQPEILTPRTYCRFVPERSDDFAWENNKIAFRAYGPALKESSEDSGIDCWLKRVEYPIINKWYAEDAKGKPYHIDHGEGYDPYKVSSSRGCGGLAIWLDGEMKISNVFTSWKIIKNEPTESIFVLNYAYQVGNDRYTEEKQISIQMNTRLFKSVSTFRKNGKLAPNLPLAIGIVRHHETDVVAKNLAEGWVSIWEPIDDSELGTGIKLTPSRILAFKLLETGKKYADHALLLTQTDANGKIEYYAGYGWKKAGEITTPEAWNEYLKLFKLR